MYHSIIIFIILLFFFSNIIYIYFIDTTPLFYKFISSLALLFILINLIFSPLLKNLFLPFLNVSAYPPSLIPNELYPPNSNFKFELDLNYPNGTKIIYWASNPILDDKNKIFNNPYDAYNDFKNSGVAIVNNHKAILHLNCPNQYKVPPFHNTLDKHIHYRISTPNNPILSDVKTIYINC
jgi:hypothetical protein